ncbi:Endoribonuclease L-PSP/chorismate mutase-like protein [Chytridium lagenaria]|nr:Endoribonuclease L-PSP/chorismate mutase-like protein [Chytridium lagenaria]
MVNGEPILLPERAGGLANYPHARKINGFIHVSGISSRRPDNTWDDLADGTWKLDIAEQTRAVITNIEYILKAGGSSLAHVVDLTVFLVDMKDYKIFQRNLQYILSRSVEGSSPSRTTVAVHQLPNPRLLIEIKAIAVDPNFQHVNITRK